MPMGIITGTRKKKKNPKWDAVRTAVREKYGSNSGPSFEYNLDYYNHPCFGICLLQDESVSVCTETDSREYSFSEMQEIRFVRGIGVVSVEISENGEDLEICRADMSLCSTLEAFVSQAEAKRSGREVKVEEVAKCPKCGKPLPKGSTVCPKCTDRKKLLSRMMAFAKKDSGLLLVSGLCLLLASGIGVILPKIRSFMIDAFLQPTESAYDGWVGSIAQAIGIRGATLSGLIAVVLTLALFGLLSAVISCVRQITSAKASANIVIRIRKELYRKIQDLSLNGLSKRSPGELITRLSGDTDQLRRFLVFMLPNLLQQCILLIAISIILLTSNWQLTLMVIAPAPLLIVLFSAVNKLTRRLYHREWQLESEANDMLHDVFSGIREVKVFGTEQYEYKRFDRCAKRIADTSKRNELIWNAVMPFSTFLLSAGEFLVIFFIGTKVYQGEATLGDLSMYLAYVATLYEPIRWFARVPRMLSRTMTSMGKIVEVLDEKDIMPNGLDACENMQGKIEFRNASFGYNPPDYVLKNINLQIKPGEFVGLVGRSGVGKTTAINLIIRMYDLNEGQLLLDGKDIRDYDSAAYRSQIGVVLQETYLFNGTIYSNLSYAKPQATRDEIVRAAKLAGAHDFIMKLPDGYNTYVGARGNTLSGGEKQRIAIARAILRNPKLLILDEATSSLDTETEKQIQDALAGLSAGRTTVAIAHRLSTLRNATKLAVFEKGELEEIGTHDELMEKQGRYYRLVMAQREMNRMAK